MTIIQALNRYKILKADAYRYKLIYIELHDTIASGGLNYDGMPHSTQISHPTESDSLRLNEAYIAYADKLNMATKQMLLVERIIRSVPDYRGRYVLAEHYLNFRSIDEIGDDEFIQRSGRQARRYHDEAIAWLEERWKGEKNECRLCMGTYEDTNMPSKQGRATEVSLL